MPLCFCNVVTFKNRERKKSPFINKGGKNLLRRKAAPKSHQIKVSTLKRFKAVFVRLDNMQKEKKKKSKFNYWVSLDVKSLLSFSLCAGSHLCDHIFFCTVCARWEQQHYHCCGVCFLFLCLLRSYQAVAVFLPAQAATVAVILCPQLMLCLEL